MSAAAAAAPSFTATTSASSSPISTNNMDIKTEKNPVAAVELMQTQKIKKCALSSIKGTAKKAKTIKRTSFYKITHHKTGKSIKIKNVPKNQIISTTPPPPPIVHTYKKPNTRLTTKNLVQVQQQLLQQQQQSQLPSNNFEQIAKQKQKKYELEQLNNNDNNNNNKYNNNNNNKPLTKETFLFTLDLLAVVRRNASDKLKLIQMVHDNPILWDSRLPNFKGAEEEKNRAWEQIGKEFNAPGRRVARAFKSLRESYRRELAHVKLMGNGFKPKWSLYDAMDFLRDVIRERKGGSQHTADQSSIGLNLSAFAQHLSNNNNNNNNSPNINHHNNHHLHGNKLNGVGGRGGGVGGALGIGGLKLNSSQATSLFNESALNLSKCSSLNMSSDYYFYNYVKPELDISGHSNGGLQHPLPAHQQQQLQLQQHLQQQQQQHNNDSRVTSTRNDNGAMISTTTNNSSSSNNNLHNNNSNSSNGNMAAHNHSNSNQNNNNNDSINHNNNTSYMDDMDASSLRSGDDASVRNAALSNEGSDEIEELEAIDADFPYPLILPTSGIGGGGGLPKRRRKDAMMMMTMDAAAGAAAGGGGDIDDNDDDDDDDDDDGDDHTDGYSGQMLQQHRHLRQQQQHQQQQQLHHQQNLLMNGGLDMPPPQTVREVLNSKFCGFISAKLNSMDDTEADNLMNKILMLLVQTQTQQINAAAAAAAAAVVETK